MCKTETCQRKSLAHGITLPVFFIAGLAVMMDLVDCVIFFAAPDHVKNKAGVNLSSSCLKWIAFGLMLGADNQRFVSDLYDNQCYNKEGMKHVSTTGQYLVSFVTTEVISALLSLMLAPLSAFYGGKLIGVPYVK